MNFIKDNKLKILIPIFYLSFFIILNGKASHSEFLEKSLVLKFFICPFHYLTHYYCPGCGMTRAFLALFHFEFFKAIQYNPFSPFLFIYGLLFPYLNPDLNLNQKKSFFSKIFSLCFLSLILIYGILRNFQL